MRSFFCLKCGRKIYIAATGPFNCNVCQSEKDKNKPKFGGTSG